MEAVMSTVFKANMPARLFDQKMKYQMQSTSLEMNREEALEATYDHWTNLSSKSRNIRRKAWKCVIFCDPAIYDDVYEMGFLESDLNETAMICGLF
jgi:hypothetical protein